MKQVLERAFHAACLRALSSLEMVVNKGGTTGTGKIARLLNLSAAHLQGILAVGDEIVEVNIATGVPIAYELDDNGKVLSKKVLVDRSYS